jgi:hypothetical protein
VVSAITGKPESAIRAQRDAMHRKLFKTPGMKIRNARPIRVHAPRRRRRSWQDDVWDIYEHLPVS